MNFVTRFSLLVLITLVSTAVSQDANCWVDEDGNAIESPVETMDNGDPFLTTPELVYEADTGIVYIDTLGLNGIVDTTSDVILGDDVGLISVILEAPQGTFIQQNSFVGGVVWSTSNQFYSTVNNTMQMVGTPAGSEFLRPTDRFELFQLATGLTAADLDVNSDGSIFIEIGVNYSTLENADGTPAHPSTTMFSTDGDPTSGCMQPISIVPEPTAISLMAMAFLGVLGVIRRR